MGIAKLAELIREQAPDAVSSVQLQDYRGRVVAVDVSVAIYQFNTAMPKIINRHGQNISALRGLFYRTMHLLENGIKPVFVFDGKPPDLKERVLAKRATVSGAKRKAADPAVDEPPQRLPRRDFERMLGYLGVPCVQAPAEAEATCAALVKSGHAWCTVTEDMDALPFGSSRLLRHLNAKNKDLEEISLPVVLQKLGLTQEQFVDLCILLGCDYCEKIRGLGPKKALPLLQQHGSIEQVLHSARSAQPPENWPLEETRRLFLHPEVAQPSRVVLEWRDPDEEGLLQFLAHEKRMKEKWVCRRLEKWRAACLKSARPQSPGPVTKGSKKQPRMVDFFPVKKRPCKIGRKKMKTQEQPGTAVET